MTEPSCPHCLPWQLCMTCRNQSQVSSVRPDAPRETGSCATQRETEKEREGSGPQPVFYVQDATGVFHVVDNERRSWREPSATLTRYNCDCLNADPANGDPTDDDNGVYCERWVYLADDVDAAMKADSRVTALEQEKQALQKLASRLEMELLGATTVADGARENYKRLEADLASLTRAQASLRDVLRQIRDGDAESCQCDHSEDDDGPCCVTVGEFCAFCIADRALTDGQPPERETL